MSTRHATTATASIALAMAFGFAGHAAAQDGQPGNSYVRLTETGDIRTSTTTIPGPLHSNIAFGAGTADYFRGSFDGVEEDIDTVAGEVGLSTTFQPIDRPGGGLTGLSITGGTSNGLTNGDAADQGTWYESDNFAGVAAEFGDAWTTGVTYTYYAAPDISGNDPRQEVAGAVRYTGDDFLGRVGPQVKVAKPVDENDGVFTELSVEPTFEVAQMRAGAVELSTPMAVGAGFNDYYGGATGNTGVFGKVGAHVSVPLGVPATYGAWRASVGGDAIFRDDTIRSAGGPLDDGGDTVLMGMARLSIAY